jgi:predicted nuclease of restriction endonuclease-like RecB superfamily
MLPSELLLVRVRRGRVLPRFSSLSDEELYIADEAVSIFRGSVGRRRRELDQELRRLEETAIRLGLHYKFVRGLSHLLYRRATLQSPRSSVDPVRLRLEVFREAGSYGACLSGEERERVLGKVAERFNLSVEEVERVFESVYEEEYVVSGFEEVSGEELLREYNLSLAQTLLFRALRVEARLRAGGQQVKSILRSIKLLGLMYIARQEGSSLVLEVEGPASLLRQTERYGTRLAKLLPLILEAEWWSVRAPVRGRRGTLIFELAKPGSPPMPRSARVEVEFDSALEESFYRGFLSLRSSWRILREPEPFVVQGHVFLPDFAFELGDKRVYLEIVGFWTPGYIERKLEKLRALKGVNLIVAVNRENACAEEFSKLGHEVVFFEKKVPVDKVYRYLKALEGPQPRRAAEEEEPPPPKAMEYLSGIERESLARVLESLGSLGLSEEEAYRAIAKAGLKIAWRGLDKNKAYVYRG